MLIFFSAKSTILQKSLEEILIPSTFFGNKSIYHLLSKLNLIFWLDSHLFISYTSGSQPGVHIPLGVHEKLKGGTPIFKNHSKQVYLARMCDLGGMQRGYNFDFGIHRGVQSWFGGTWVSKGWEPLSYTNRPRLH